MSPELRKAVALWALLTAFSVPAFSPLTTALAGRYRPVQHAAVDSAVLRKRAATIVEFLQCFLICALFARLAGRSGAAAALATGLLLPVLHREPFWTIRLMALVGAFLGAELGRRWFAYDADQRGGGTENGSRSPGRAGLDARS